MNEQKNQDGAERAAIYRAIEAAGSKTALAKLTGVSASTVDRWGRDGFAPPQHHAAISSATAVETRDLHADFLRGLAARAEMRLRNIQRLIDSSLEEVA